MRFRGKIAIWFWAVFIIGDIVTLCGLLTPGDGMAAGVIGFIIFNAVFLPILLRNYVLLENDRLVICFGIGRDSIRLDEILEVYQTHDPIASSAASLDRIVIKGKRNELMCSVTDKESLFLELKKRNPQIVIR